MSEQVRALELDIYRQWKLHKIQFVKMLVAGLGAISKAKASINSRVLITVETNKCAHNLYVM